MFKMSTISPSALLTMICNSGILLELLLVEQQHRKFQFHASSPAVFLVSWHTLCSLNHSIDKSLMVLSQEIRVNTLPFLSLYSPSGEMNTEKISHTGMVIWWHSIMLKISL